MKKDFALHYWVSARSQPDAETVQAAFSKESDAKTWATAQSTIHRDTRDVWHCVADSPAKKLVSYCRGKVVA